jgi:predicted peptidase
MLKALLFLVLVSADFGLNWLRAEEQQNIDSFESTITHIVGYKYLISLPKTYSDDSLHKWPLIIYLHGSGERGTDPWRLTRHGPPRLLHPGISKYADPIKPGTPPESPEVLENRALSTKILSEQFIVISPQCPSGKSWEDEAVIALLDKAITRYNVDTSRVYLTGNSMGGYGTWSVGLKNSHRFAALVPICGGIRDDYILRQASEHKEELLSLGIWAFHGEKDPTVPVSQSRQVIAMLEKAKLTDVKLTTYPEAKHDSWTQTYDNPSLYAWLLKHVRTKLK